MDQCAFDLLVAGDYASALQVLQPVPETAQLRGTEAVTSPSGYEDIQTALILWQQGDCALQASAFVYRLDVGAP